MNFERKVMNCLAKNSHKNGRDFSHIFHVEKEALFSQRSTL